MFDLRDMMKVIQKNKFDSVDCDDKFMKCCGGGINMHESEIL